MKPSLSAFLDLTRILAALTVFLDHLSAPQYGGALLHVFTKMGHSAVIVFFVLSGFVIAWAVRRDGSPRDYALSRAARIYSVALPALVLTWTIDNFLIQYHPGALNTIYQHMAIWKYLPLFLTFSTDFWFLAEDALSNIPYWSLCYEVWYYVVFGALVFARGAWRWIIVIACLLIMGPRLWLLWPVWLAGAFLHRLPPLPVSRSRLLLFLSLAALVAVKASGIEEMLNDALDRITGGFAGSHLRYSQFFAGDYLVAATVVAAIHAARGAELALLARLRRPLAALASITFSMYLIHFPLFLFFGALFPGQVLVIGLLSLAVITAFGIVFERNKALLRRVLAALWPMRPAYRQVAGR
jgi:peptidoglycan/LPS O-acetylase OafA/YrhL